MLLKEKMLLKDRPSSAIVAVRDLDRAREFYTNTLGLYDEGGSPQRVLGLKTGNTRLVVYESDQAGTNKANAVVWSGGEEFDAIIDQLREQGVEFEKYPELGMAIEDGVHRAGDFKGAWFKDPDGNILHVNNM